MTREQALAKVRKLRGLTVERGATPAEADTARRRAAALIERFSLTAFELGERLASSQPAPPAPPSPPAGWFVSPDGSLIVALGGWVPTTGTATGGNFAQFTVTFT